MSYSVGERAAPGAVTHQQAPDNKYGNADDKPGDDAGDGAADGAYDKAGDALEAIGLSLFFGRTCRGKGSRPSRRFTLRRGANPLGRGRRLHSSLPFNLGLFSSPDGIPVVAPNFTTAEWTA